LLKNILAYCGYSPTSPFFFLLSEHKHCHNAATNSNNEKARDRMVASLRGSVGTGTKEDVSSTGSVWAAGFHHVTARFRFALFIPYEPFISLIFQIFLGRGQLRVTENADTESADTALHLHLRPLLPGVMVVRLLHRQYVQRSLSPVSKLQPFVKV
jgi:hypothetical protein